MKQINILLIIFFIPIIIKAQSGVGIGTLNPDKSAILDIVSNDKGMLVPRMDSVQRINIKSPAIGLLVFDNTKKAFCYYNGASWKCLDSQGAGSQGVAGEKGINCWDVNGNRINDAAEDTNGDGLFNSLDCKGEKGTQGIGIQGVMGLSGIDCWDINGNRINDAAEDTNNDGVFNTLDCKGTSTAGSKGINCWDINGNNINDVTEDTNKDGLFNALDCKGENGIGLQGVAGLSGINCWDTNENRINDAAEDTNKDGLFNTLDCKSSSTTTGLNGINCWDINGNNIAEDTNKDGQFNALDCKGEKGEKGVSGAQGVGIQGVAGLSGINCWDINGNRINDIVEDTNNDGVFNALDCQSNLALAQKAITVLTSTTTLFNDATINTWTTVQGLSTNITVAANDILVISSDGIVENASTATTAFSDLLIAIFVDDVIATPILELGNQNQSGVINVSTQYSSLFTTSLSAGTHSIKVKGKKKVPFLATWVDTNVYNAKLSVIKLKS
jgi:hypothetical protein